MFYVYCILRNKLFYYFFQVVYMLTSYYWNGKLYFVWNMTNNLITCMNPKNLFKNGKAFLLTINNQCYHQLINLCLIQNFSQEVTYGQQVLLFVYILDLFFIFIFQQNKYCQQFEFSHHDFYFSFLFLRFLLSHQ